MNDAAVDAAVAFGSPVPGIRVLCPVPTAEMFVAEYGSRFAEGKWVRMDGVLVFMSSTVEDPTWALTEAITAWAADWDGVTGWSVDIDETSVSDMLAVVPVAYLWRAGIIPAEVVGPEVACSTDKRLGWEVRLHVGAARERARKR